MAVINVKIRWHEGIGHEGITQDFHFTTEEFHLQHKTDSDEAGLLA